MILRTQDEGWGRRYASINGVEIKQSRSARAVAKWLIAWADWKDEQDGK